jgi:hypothetical protein
VTTSDILKLVSWCLASLVIGFAATHALVERALALPTGAMLPSDFLIRTGLWAGGGLLLLAVVAGLLVFRPTMPWEVLLTWPWLVGGAIALGSFMAVAGHSDGGSQLCDQPPGTSCDTAWGFGAMLLAVMAGAIFGGVAILVALIRRLVAGQPS